MAGDMSSPHGVNMMQGAQIAIDELGEFTAGGTTYKFELVEVDTADLTGDVEATRVAVEAMIDDVAYVIGGFRTEHTHVMLEVVCEDNGKIFLGLGAGGLGLTGKVQADFDNYKYFFRLLPLNDYFLVTSAFKIVQSVILTLLDDPDLPFNSTADINVYILAENAEWAHPAVVLAETTLLPALGVNHVGTARPGHNASAGDLSPTIADMYAKDTHVVMTIMAGTVGFSWAAARAGAHLPVISAGINAMAHMSAFGQLGAAALGEITLDATAEDVQLSPLTQPFFTEFRARHDAYPLYTGVSAYSAIRVLKAGIQETGSLSSDDIAAAVPGLDLDSVSGKIAFYPRAAIDLGYVQPGLRALSAAQAYALHGEHLLAFYEEPDLATLEANWSANNYVADWTSPPHHPQDIGYGPAIGNTAIAAQWQGTAANPMKVAVWPMQHLPPGTPVATLKAMGLFDKWGNWNFQFPGTADLFIPPLFYDTWGGVVNFPDPNLEAAVRETIGKPSGPIHSSDLVGLTWLDASNRDIADLTGLEHCTDLVELWLGGNQIGDIAALAGLTNLTGLGLGSNNISHIAPLAELTDLTWLVLGWNQISHISPLANLTSLTSMDLSGNRIGPISALEGLTNLTYLYLSHNEIIDVSPLVGLTHLRDLWLSGNQIENVSPLAHLTALESLALDANAIEDVLPLADLTALWYLDLGENQISDLGPLGGLTSLTQLGLRSNKISDILALSTLTGLEGLVLKENQISNLWSLAGLTNLTWLDLTHNQISDITPLVDNPGLGTGDYVYLRYNYLDLTPGSQAMDDIETLQVRGVEVHYDPQSEIPYALTISSTAGGSVTTPGEGAFSYPLGTVVTLVASPAGGYQFVTWTGNVGTIADVSAASTNITMNGDYSITANFELMPSCATLSPTANVYDLDNPGDVTTLITWNDSPKNITSIFDGTADLESGTHYTMTPHNGTATLTIRTAYLAGELLVAGQVVVLTITFPDACEATFTITAYEAAVECITISPSTGQYDLANPGNVSTTITNWGSVSSITSIHDGVGDLTAGADYTVVGNAITILNTYLAGRLTAPGQSIVLIINCEPICAVLFVISAIDSSVTCATISPTARQYDLSNPTSQTTTITWNSASSITSIVDNGTTLVSGTHYTVVGNTLTILNAYLAGKLTVAGQTVTLSINFDVCSPSTFTITAIET